ncbi:MAG TPA: hypothetical protein PLW09_04415 [Candidatus Kapabacteria bacterium]|nr:hypothetical protein [Candidatus Kapabacteria bacterium]
MSPKGIMPIVAAFVGAVSLGGESLKRMSELDKTQTGIYIQQTGMAIKLISDGIGSTIEMASALYGKHVNPLILKDMGKIVFRSKGLFIANVYADARINSIKDPEAKTKAQFTQSLISFGLSVAGAIPAVSTIPTGVGVAAAGLALANVALSAKDVHRYGIVEGGLYKLFDSHEVELARFFEVLSEASYKDPH